MNITVKHAKKLGFKLLLSIKGVIFINWTILSPFADTISHKKLEPSEIVSLRELVAEEFSKRRCQPTPSKRTLSLGTNVLWTVGSSFQIYQLSCDLGAYLETTAWYRVERGRIEPLRIKHPVFTTPHMNTLGERRKDLKIEKFIFDHFLINAMLDPKTARLIQNSYCCAGDLFRRTRWRLKGNGLILERYDEDFLKDGRHEPQLSFEFKE